MKSLRFESISLMSHRDGKALRTTFHPRKNLILGRNHTGKTSLIRSLFDTLGARPSGNLELWDPNTSSLVQFTIDDKKYFALRQRGNRSMFDSSGELIFATTQHSDWTAHFGNITGFNLVFSDKQSDAVLADPACFFVPFYINQDGSWQAEWNTFQSMKRYSAPWTPILEYFTGITPPEYYSLKAERDKNNKDLTELRSEQRLLERTKERFSKSMPLSGPKIHPENFEQEISSLTAQVNGLNSRQETLRNTAVREEELLSDLQTQIRLAREALASYDRDTTFLRDINSERLVCPTCGAEHAKSFIDFLTFAEDARVIQDLLSTLRENATTVRQKATETRAELTALDSQYRYISNILETRRGEMRFGQVVDSLGAESAFMAFRTTHTGASR